MQMRDYERDVVARVRATGRPVETLGQVEGMPLLRVIVEASADLPSVYVNGGTHGDEPAGLEAALRFLEARCEPWLDRFRFEVIPCLNPTGYRDGTRENAAGVDLNWAYPRTELPEIAALRTFLEGRRFHDVIDLHEDWESPGYYLYEQVRVRPPAGPRVAERVAAVCPINAAEVIEGENARNGVIFPDLTKAKRLRGDGVPIMLFRNGLTDRLVTSETPTALDLDVRARAHLEAIDAILDAG